jgi:hypothetical protein
MTLKLMLETFVGAAALTVWFFHYTQFWEIMEKGGVPKRGLPFYRWIFTLFVAAIAHLLVGNIWFTLGLATPLWLFYLVSGLEWAVGQTCERSLLGEWIWFYTFLLLPTILILAYILAPAFQGNTSQVFNNVDGVALGMVFGAVAGSLAGAGGMIGLLRWKAHAMSGGVIGGMIGWLVPLVVLTVEFDSIAFRAGFQYSALRLYVLGFIPACLVMAAVAFLASLVIAALLELISD